MTRLNPTQEIDKEVLSLIQICFGFRCDSPCLSQSLLIKRVMEGGKSVSEKESQENGTLFSRKEAGAQEGALKPFVSLGAWNMTC